MRGQSQMNALLISPDRTVAQQFAAVANSAGTFEILTELQSYPAPETLATRMTQAGAEVLLLDVATDLDTAAALIRHASALRPAIPAIALHRSNDAQAILKSLRCGALEFLFSPFEASIQQAAIARIRKASEPANPTERERGRVIAFTNAKPGAGASTLAVQTAFALQRATSGRVLLADFDLSTSAVGFLLNLQHEHSVLDLLRDGQRLTPEAWAKAVSQAGEIAVLAAPEFPEVQAVEPPRLQQVLDWARGSFDWIVVDLPNIFERASLVTVSDADQAFIVSTPELASLHLTRRAVKLLQQLEFDSSRYQILINRMTARSDVSNSDLSKLFDCRVDRALPADRAGVTRAMRDGTAADVDSALGRAVGALADKLAGITRDRKQKGGNSATAKANASK
jgi:pilus assembly protein CpaE